jgi:hypothetical protein
VFDHGEGNGQWDPGEKFDDFNGNKQWDDYVEPMEIAGYFQNTFEVPWMVINAGLRIDAVNYNSKIWSKPDGTYSPTKPWFWEDCGFDGLCPGHSNYNLSWEDGGADIGVLDPITGEYDLQPDGYGDPDINGTELNGEWDTWFIGDSYSPVIGSSTPISAPPSSQDRL